MKIRLPLTLVGLAIIFALPTFAQQKDTIDPQIIEGLHALTNNFIDAIDNNDATALAAVFTEDAVFVSDRGPVYGREAIEKYWAELFKQVHVSNHVSKDDQYSPHILGTNEVWRNAEWSETLQSKTGGPIQLKGYWAGIEVKEGDAWKHRMLIANITPPPAAETK